MADTKESTEPGTSMAPSSDDLRDVNPVLAGSTGIKSGFSFDTAFQQIYHFLEKSEREQQLDCERLIATFKYMQKCCLSSKLVFLLDAGVFEKLGRTYDRLVQGDYGKQEVLTSILELLYLIEDMSESVEGKAQCGKYFIGRLLALATTAVQSVNLHRAAVETLCAIITKSAANQQRVIDDRAACLKLFKQCLPCCGDFQLQASLTEVYYRLLKLDPQLLDLMTEKRVRGAMEALLQQQKPDLLAKIKEFVILLNECMGPLRSVYTFLATKILLNGQNVTPDEEKLISFGKAHFSFYQTDIQIDGPTILDVEYKDILELKSGSKSILEMVVQDSQNICSAQNTSVNQHKQVRILVSMAPHDFPVLETHVLPKLRTQTISAQTGIELGMRKSSIGIMSPQSKESTLAFQPRNEEQRYLPPHLREVPKRSDIYTCQNSNVADELEVVQKENWSKPTDAPARKKENFSEEPAIVKATPQKGIPSIPLASPCKEFPSAQMQSDGKELWKKLHARQKISEENAQDFDSSVPLSRLVEARNVDKKQGEFPTGHERSEYEKDTRNDRHSEEEKSCSSELNDTRLQAQTTTNTLSANKVTVGRRNLRFSEKESKADPQLCIFDRKVHNQPSTPALGGIMKSTKDVRDDQTVMGHKNRTKNHQVREESILPLKLKVARGADKTYGFENGPEVKQAKQTSEASGKKILQKVGPSIRGKGPSDKKIAETRKKNHVARKYPTRRATWQKPESQSSDPKYKSDSERTLTSNSDEDWAPDKENADPIETESGERKIGVDKSRLHSGSPRQKSCNNTGKKGELPIRLRSGKSIISNGQVQHTSKVSAVQRRNTAHTDVYSFTSDEEERTKCKASVTKPREKNQGSKRLNQKGRARTLSFTSIQEQPGKVHLITRAFKAVSPQKKRQRVQKEDRRQVAEPTDNDVFIIPKPGDSQRAHKNSKIDKVQKHSRIERWKSSTYRDHIIPESNVEPEESVHVSSSDTSAGQLSPKTGTDVNVPDTPSIPADDKDLQIITTLIKEFKERVKSDTKRKTTDIVSHTSQLIHHGIEGTQRQIQKDVADFVQISKDKYGYLNSKLEGQTKRMRQVYEQFQKDFNEHIQQYEKIVEEIDGTDRELTDVARKRGQEHKELFERLQETSMRHLADADQKVLSVTKASEAMYGLRTAVEGLISLED